MSTWNYRVIQRSYPLTDEVELTICEVYYNKDGDITAWSDAMEPSGQTLDELERDLLAMRVAIGMGALREVDDTLIPVIPATDRAAGRAENEQDDADNKQ